MAPATDREKRQVACAKKLIVNQYWATNGVKSCSELQLQMTAAFMIVTSISFCGLSVWDIFSPALIQ